MKRCKITILKTMLNEELAKAYAAPGFTRCPMMRGGQAFHADYADPDGFCDEVRKAVCQHVSARSHGAEIFRYDRRIAKGSVASRFCNDPSQRIITKIERTAKESRRGYKPIV